MSRWFRSVLAMVAALAATMAMLVWQAPLSHAAACSSAKSGVTVVVDYQSLGGGVVTACAPGDPGSALAALNSAGFSTTRASREFSGYFLCRINGKPAADPCVKASPTTAYWSFWHGSAGGSWAYSQSGVASWDPPPGSAVGFSFGAGAQPGIKPPAVSSGSTSKPAPKPTATASPRSTPAPSTTSKAPVRGSSGASKPASGGSTSSPGLAATQSNPASAGTSSAGSPGTSRSSGPTSGSSSAAASGSTRSTATATAGSPSASGSSDAGPAATVAAGAPQSTSSSSGTAPVAVGAGVVAVVGLGGAGFVAARRRRS